VFSALSKTKDLDEKNKEEEENETMKKGLHAALP
jgi:hypothetical protein